MRILCLTLDIVASGNPRPFSNCYCDLADSVEARMEGLFARASSIFFADIVFQNLDKLDELEVLLLVFISIYSVLLNMKVLSLSLALKILWVLSNFLVQCDEFVTIWCGVEIPTISSIYISWMENSIRWSVSCQSSDIVWKESKSVLLLTQKHSYVLVFDNLIFFCSHFLFFIFVMTTSR